MEFSSRLSFENKDKAESKTNTETSKSGKSVKGADKALEDSEQLINKQLDTLTALIDKTQRKKDKAKISREIARKQARLAV